MRGQSAWRLRPLSASCQGSAQVDNVFSGLTLHLGLAMGRASDARWWDIVFLDFALEIVNIPRTVRARPHVPQILRDLPLTCERHWLAGGIRFFNGC